MKRSAFIKTFFMKAIFFYSSFTFAINIYPHEMPPTLLKDIILQHIHQDSNIAGAGNAPNFLNASVFSQNEQLLKNSIIALMLMANKEHTLARCFLEQTFFREKHCSVVQTSWNNNFGNKSILIPYLKGLDISPIKTNHPYKKKGYHSYYENKRENFLLTEQKLWKTKQKNIREILEKHKPKSVLDIGSNKGWFSLLAEYMGAQVVSTDIDEYCIENLYQKSKKANLNIVPVLKPFKDLSKVKSGNRFKSELVMCLALVHHLVLAGGHSLDEIFETLSDVTQKILVLEYVDLTDPRIKDALSNPEYKEHAVVYNTVVNNLKNYASKNYTLSNFIKIGKKHFKSVEIFDSHPGTRKLLVFLK
jgi:SAM-dependent methyltransferase